MTIVMVGSLNPFEELIKEVVDDIKFIANQLTEIYRLKALVLQEPKKDSLTVEQFHKACNDFDERVADRMKPPITSDEISDIVLTAVNTPSKKNNQITLEL